MAKHTFCDQSVNAQLRNELDQNTINGCGLTGSGLSIINQSNDQIRTNRNASKSGCFSTSRHSETNDLISTLIVADGSCPKIRELLAEALVPVLWMDGEQEPLAAISEALSERREQGHPVQALHWVSHGSPGVLCVGKKR